ncbi:hypothetical protein [Bradyrhizobium yuanmingense]|uniref:hypothetical protein n=1 Tax=Bradyrhizobium yuanmingense TaxID=108015 RepID=UPI0023B95638|nr:hypothetical protein [Bradyrhizobium yuanmingense]MDF0495377.1 hypothetical protein [Bradyrhizobium yuanmingense]
MSDINPGAGIDSALDSAFAAIGEATEPAAVGEGEQRVLPPNVLSDEGIWNLDREEKERAKAEKAAKSKDGKDVKDDKDSKAEAKDGKHDRDKSRAVDNKRENKRSQLASLDAALDKAFDKAPKAVEKRKEDRAAEVKGEKPKPLSTKDFKDTREHRRSIKALFPGEKLSQVLTIAEKWDGLLREKPTMETVEKLAAEILKLPRTAKGKEQAEATEGRTKALDRATEDAADHEDITAFVEKYGDRLPSILERLSVWLPEIKEDPYGAGARLLASMGAIDPPQAPTLQPQQQPAQQLPPPATPQEDYERVSLGVQKAIEHNVLPGLANDAIAEAVAEVLTRMPRTNDRFADLQKAYAIVVQAAAPAAATPAAPKDDKGSKSISGAPSPASGPRRAKGGAKGLDDALNRAFGGM